MSKPPLDVDVVEVAEVAARTEAWHRQIEASLALIRCGKTEAGAKALKELVADLGCVAHAMRLRRGLSTVQRYAR